MKKGHVELAKGEFKEGNNSQQAWNCGEDREQGLSVGRRGRARAGLSCGTLGPAAGLSVSKAPCARCSTRGQVHQE